MKLRLGIFFLAILSLGVNSSDAGTIVVDPATDDLKTAIESAAAGDVVELLQGTHVVPTPAGAGPTVSTCLINVPAGVTITADPAAPHGSVVVQAGDNSRRATVFCSTGADITISGIRFVPAADAANGGRAVWLALGGGNLTFNDNIVDKFTDALFAFGQSGGSVNFRNNRVTVIDRDPDTQGGILGGNAALTVVFANLDSLDASGNTIHGPGRNVSRFVAVTGLIIFNTTQTIGSIDIWNNAISNFDFAVFSSGEVGIRGARISENRLHTNGVGVGVGQVPDPSITVPTPADNTLIAQNRITGNDFGIFVAANAVKTTISRNQIAGNREAAIIDDAAPGETTIGENLIRGKDTGNRPAIPPGMAFDPVVGPPGS